MAFNAFMPGEHNYQMGKPMQGMPGAQPAPQVAQAQPQKRQPIMNAFSKIFEYGAPEAFQQGRDKRLTRDLGNALADGNYSGAAEMAFRSGDLEAGEKYRTNAETRRKTETDEQRKTEAQGTYQLFNSMQPAQINDYAMQDPVGFERMTGMSSEEYLQSAKQMQQYGMTQDQFRQFVIQRAQAELGVEGQQTEYGFTHVPGVGLVSTDSRTGAANVAVAAAPKPEERWEDIEAPPGMPGYYQRSTTTGQTRRVAAPPDAGVNVYTGDVGAGSRPIVDKPEKGFQRIYNSETNSYEDRPIPGADAAREREEDAFREYMKLQTSEFNYDNVTNEIDRAIGLAGPLTAGVGGALLKDLPMTSARTLNNAITTVKANLGFDRLQQMREESKTGGALGAVTEKEIDLLQSTVQRLDQLTDPQELIRALGVVKEQYIKVQTLRQQMYAMKYGTTEPGQSRPTPAASTPVTSNDLPPGFEMVP